MAIIKKDTFIFANGKQLVLPNGIVTITRRLELTDYYSRNILYCESQPGADKKADKVINIYNLDAHQLIEIADAMTHLWIDLKDNVRLLGIDNPEIFNTKRSDK